MTTQCLLIPQAVNADFALPADYPGSGTPTVTVRAHRLNRTRQAEFNRQLAQHIDTSLAGNECLLEVVAYITDTLGEYLSPEEEQVCFVRVF